MEVTKIQKTISAVALGLVSCLAFVQLVYHAGAESGRSEVQSAWDKTKSAQAEQLLLAQKTIQVREVRHRQETDRLVDQLRKSEASHEATVSAVRVQLTERLRASDARSLTYQRLSEGGTAACGDLSGYAARLDRALVEGQGLVRELGSTIELRDDQLRSLGAVITNDRMLLGGN